VLFVHLPDCLGEEIAKGLLRFSSQKSTCYFNPPVTESTCYCNRVKPLKGRGIQLSSLPEDTSTSELAGLSSH